MFSCVVCAFFFFKQKTAYEMRISDWSSDVCSSDLWLNSHLIVGLLATFTVTTILLIYRELTHEHPIINLRLLRNPNFAVANLMIIAMGIDRKSVVWGKSVSVRVDLGGRGIIKKTREWDERVRTLS